MTYSIHYSNGETRSNFSTESSAMNYLIEEYPDAYFSEEWESHTPDTERLLVWQDELASEGDSGQNAIAEIVRRIES